MTQVAKQSAPVAKRSMAQFLALPVVSENLESTLKDKKSAFVSNLIALSESDASLQQCDSAALMKCAMNATALDLPLSKSLGHAYVIAYKNNKKGIFEPSFQIGTRGLIQLALRTNMYHRLNAVEVREGEIEHDKFTQEFKIIRQNPKGKIVGYLALLKLLSGFEASVYMTEEQMEAHAFQYSKVYQSDKKYNSKKSLWSNPAERHKMGCKTVFKKLLSTYGLLSTEIQEAMTKDSVVEETMDGVAEDVTYTEVKPQADPTEKKEAKKVNLNDI